MKKVLISLTVIIIFLLTSTQIVSATTKGAKSEKLETSIFDEDFPQQFNPNSEPTTKQAQAVSKPFVKLMTKIASAILTIIQVLGGLGAVLSMALFGLHSIVGVDPSLAHDLFGHKLPTKDSPDYKKVLQDTFRRLIIGSILLFSGGTIVKAVMELLL